VRLHLQYNGKQIILATWNETKQRWLQQGFMAASLPVRPLYPGEVPDVDETGDTCVENALLKARAVYQTLKDENGVVVAEDSALCVDALAGFPGARTARWAPGSDDDRSRLLLEKLAHIPEAQRTAHFLSVIALIFPAGQEHLCDGTLYGSIALAPLGEYAEGYDRIFTLSDGQTIAQVGRAQVEPFDHRRQAIHKALALIQAWTMQT